MGAVLAAGTAGGPIQILGWVLGVALAILGLVVLRRARRLDRARENGPSPATRTAWGLSLVILGYHAFGYVSPASWFPLKVPIDLWWLVPAVAGVCVTASHLLDRSDARHRDGRS